MTSKLEELIAKLCPNGVEYKTIGEIATLSRGKVMSKSFIKDNSGEYPVYSSQTENNGQFGSISTYMYDGKYVTWTTDGANAGTVFYRDGKFNVTNVCGVIDISDCQVDTKYVYYALTIHAKNYVSSGMGNAKLMSNVMSKVTIPIPPLDVQEEIVRILDTFTELTAELTAELTTRKKQYEYYRDAFFDLDYDDNSSVVSLNDVIISLNTGLNPRQFFKLNTPDAKNYYITIREMRDGNIITTENTNLINEEAMKLCNNRSNLEKNDILFSGTGTIGETVLIKETPLSWNIKEGVYAIKPNSKVINPKYLRYFLTSSQAKSEYMKKSLVGRLKVFQ